MSVFYKNTCQYNNCRKNFYTLKDLIVHIENDHLDFDPYKIEQLEEEKPESLPLSYVLKFSTAEDSPPRYSCKNESLFANQAVIEENEIPNNDVVTSFNNNYIGSDSKDKKAPSCLKSNDLRLKEELSSHILSNHELFTLDHSHKKPFGCNMPGCEKRYKNVNGIKYHYKNYHKIYAPMFKKSLLKYPKSKVDKQSVLGIPLVGFKPQACAPVQTDLYHNNMQSMTRYEELEGPPSDYFYKFSTMSTSTDFQVCNQVPLSNMSFNYYNVSDVNGDIEDFCTKNPSVFVPNYEKL